jgi:hypothetical protein
MRAMQSNVELVAIYQPGSQRHEFFGVPIVGQSIECDSFDAIVLTSMEQTRELALELEELYGAEKLVVPAMLPVQSGLLSLCAQRSIFKKWLLNGLTTLKKL